MIGKVEHIEPIEPVEPLEQAESSTEKEDREEPMIMSPPDGDESEDKEPDATTFEDGF